MKTGKLLGFNHGGQTSRRRPDRSRILIKKRGEPMNLILYGPILGKIRREKMIKAEIVARNLGISAATYSRIETGRCSASYERVEAICDELGISPGQLNELIVQARPIH